MTAPAELSLDHVGAIATDLAAAAARWERLGFSLSPLSRQRGAVPGQTGMHPWATANRCAVFQRGYLELIGVVDSAAFNPWRRFLGRFEGLHLVALRCSNADAAYAALKARAAFLDPPVARERNLDYRGETRTMRFRNIFSRDAECPEGRYIVIEHQTPELLWQPELMHHENGALALLDAELVADDPAASARIAALGDPIRVVAPDRFAQRYGWTPAIPAFGAITIGFAHLPTTLEFLARRGIEPCRSGADVWLPPALANGFVMRLVQHD